MNIVIQIFEKYSGVFIDGLLGTLWLSLISVLLATIIGCFLALVKLSKNKVANLLVNGYMSIIRGTPILLQLYFFWLLLPKIVPFSLSDTTCIIVALVINASCYVTEVIRAGIQAVDVGQMEAAKSLGMSPINTFIRVISPQAIKNILPALGSQYIMMVKQTSLASVFFISELMTSYKTIQSATFLAIPPLIVTGIIYFVLISVLTKCVDNIERVLNKNEANVETKTAKPAFKRYTKKYANAINTGGESL